MRDGSVHQEDAASTQGAFNGQGTHGARTHASQAVEDADTDTLQELGQTLEALAHTIERRTARVNARTQVAMRDNPWATVGIAGFAGAAIAMVVLPARSRSSNRTHFLSRLQDMEMPHISMPSVPIQAPSLPSRKTLVQYAEQAADAITKIDPSALSTERLGGVGEFLSSALSKIAPRK